MGRRIHCGGSNGCVVAELVRAVGVVGLYKGLVVVDMQLGCGKRSSCSRSREM